MSFPLLPLVSSPSENDIISEVSVVGQILLPYDSIQLSKHFLSQFPNHLKINVDVSSNEVLTDDVIDVLNSGVNEVFVSEIQAEEAISSGLPSSRLVIRVASDDIASKIIDSDASIVLKSGNTKEVVLQLANGGNRTVYYQLESQDQNTANNLAKDGLVLIVEAEKLTKLPHDSNKISISNLFTSTLTTDRNDGLFTTLVTTPAPSFTALGIVYSSVESIQAAIAEGEGVYQSRKRRNELWYKGRTSGATQKLVALEKDCDSDAIKFIVEQRQGSGFCHLDNHFTCFHDGGLKKKDEGLGTGLSKLDNTLSQRLETAPEGSYTKRLFDDGDLLIAKLKEELDELIEAGEKKDKDEVAWESADLIYFVLVWCVKHGVRLQDIEKNLDIKSMKVSRRKGDAKPAYISKKQEEPIVQSYKMETIRVNGKSTNSILVQKALKRPSQKTSEIMKLVLPIVEKVKKEGDKALLELTSKFDGVKLDSPILEAPFPPEYMDISDDMKSAIDLSMNNIETFHRAQLPKEKVMTVETSSGVKCSRFSKPIENVGLYVPGGTAVLPSTAMMLGVPAKVAGCSNIIIASPPSKNGRLTPEVVYVAHKLGARCILMAGGAQAVTAMAYGTESVLKCDKILGPGNQFVTAAKMHVQNDTQALCSIDMPAGPSEVLVIADESADADFVASDLLSQAEHGVDSQVILIGVGLSEKKLSQFEAAVEAQAKVLPRRDIVSKCLSHSYILLVDKYEEAFDLSNEYAPEHLILQIENASSYVPDYIANAGSVFVGGLSPESCGDYSSGTNHTLPTYGYARQYSGVNTSTFLKFITSQEVSEEGLKSIGKAVMTLAAVEGLEAHRNAIHVRMEKLGLL
ncbi:uncharacterized protein PRCAT00004526001 [Priceomyces carsonii]|uniref:uncharacterized protein n=1 Tax=Priceomyces carsonii TaxID=28549 RepID=UPI002ED9E660|nr:unnamed protein product [Priceomyces carsonii]